MTEFQAIAVGLLGLTHPEVAIARFRAGEKPATSVSNQDVTELDELLRRSDGHGSVAPAVRESH
jgi:hypothetical protein